MTKETFKPIYLYHLSFTDDTDDDEFVIRFTPRVPKSTMKDIKSNQSYEDEYISRVCLSLSISHCIKAMPKKIALDKYDEEPNITVYEYIIKDYDDLKYFYAPNTYEVGDVDKTKEIWCLKPITLNFIGYVKPKYNDNGRIIGWNSYTKNKKHHTNKDFQNILRDNADTIFSYIKYNGCSDPYNVDFSFKRLSKRLNIINF